MYEFQLDEKRFVILDLILMYSFKGVYSKILLHKNLVPFVDNQITFLSQCIVFDFLFFFIFSMYYIFKIIKKQYIDLDFESEN